MNILKTHLKSYLSLRQPFFFLRLLTSNSTAADNVSDSGESHAYYSRVAKDVSLELQPPPLKEHLYQNFDQVFLAMEQRQQHQHPDLLNDTAAGTTHDGGGEQFYENTRSMSPPDTTTKEVVVNDEK